MKREVRPKSINSRAIKQVCNSKTQICNEPFSVLDVVMWVAC